MMDLGERQREDWHPAIVVNPDTRTDRQQSDHQHCINDEGTGGIVTDMSLSGAGENLQDITQTGDGLKGKRRKVGVSPALETPEDAGQQQDACRVARLGVDITIPEGIVVSNATANALTSSQWDVLTKPSQTYCIDYLTVSI